MNRDRCIGFSNSIDLRWFARESKRLLWYGFLFAAVFQALLGLFVHTRSMVAIPARAKPEPERIIRADIIEIQTQPGAPYAAGKPHFAPRPLRPHGISRSDPRLPGMTGIPGADKRLPSPLRDRAYTFRSEPLQTPEWEARTDSTYTRPKEVASGVRVERLIPGETALKDELLTPDDFSDTGAARTRGMVFYNPNHKMGVRGVIPLPTLYTTSKPAKNLSPGIYGLAEGLRLLTDITISARQTSPFLYDFLRLLIGTDVVNLDI